MFFIIALYALLAATFSLGWSVLHYVAPFFFIGLRMSVAGLLLLGYQWVSSGRWQIKKKDYALFAGAILFHIYGAYITEFWALQFVSGAKTALIYNLSPFITALLAYWFLHEYLTPKKWLGLAIGIVGFIPTFWANGLASSLWFFSWPELMLLVSVVAACIGWIIMKRLLRRGYSPILVNGVAMLGGGLLSFITSAATESWSPLPVYAWWPMLWHMALLILLANVFYYNFYGHLLRRYTATFLSFAGFVTPLFTALYDWLFFGTRVGTSFFATTACVAVGLWLFYQDEMSKHVA